jgi:hypothetical protein
VWGNFPGLLVYLALISLTSGFIGKDEGRVSPVKDVGGDGSVKAWPIKETDWVEKVSVIYIKEAFSRDLGHTGSSPQVSRLNRNGRHATGPLIHQNVNGVAIPFPESR